MIEDYKDYLKSQLKQKDKTIRKTMSFKEFVDFELMHLKLERESSINN